MLDRRPPRPVLKGAGTCLDEYKANKDAIRPAAAGTTPAPAPTPSPAPAPAPSQRSAPAPAPRTQATKQAGGGEDACASGYAHLPSAHTAVQFCRDTEAQARCPGAPVVWVNTKSKIYHYAAANTYGRTKEGAYMCETDAQAEGDHPSSNGH